ncbi:CYIR protein, partial [Plasmodium cynomolgi strain B]
EKHLEKLPSYEEYKKWDDIDIKGYSDNYCENDLKSTKEEDKTFCYKVSKHLKRLSGLSDNDRKHGCFYFQYWFLDQLRKRYSSDNKFNNKPVSDKLFDIVADIIKKRYSNLGFCQCNQIFLFPKDWKEEKDLYDYFENHKDIKCNDSDKSKCEKYVKYVTYIKTLYEQNYERCCDNEWSEEPCKPYFKCEDTFSPQKLLNQLATELQKLGEKQEAPRDKGTEGVAVDAAAKPAPRAHVPQPPAPPEPKEALDEEVLEVAEDEVAEEGEPGPLEGEATVILQDTVPFSPPPIENPGEDVHTGQYYTSELARNIVPLTIADSPNTLGTTHEELDSKFFRNIIMAVAVLGTIFFLFYYNRVIAHSIL